jgi:hypothetical protein
MSTPSTAIVTGPPVLMTALAELFQTSWAGRLPNVAPGQSFWANPNDVNQLIAGGLARLWQSGDPAAPPPEPPYTANGIPGVAAGTSNASH